MLSFTKIDIDLFLIFYDIIEMNRMVNSKNGRFELTEMQLDTKKEPSKKALNLNGRINANRFEHLIRRFASNLGRFILHSNDGVELMARIAKPKAGDSIYDPTSGSSSLLIRAAKYAGIKQVAIYGHEMNGSSWSMGKMNMFIHDIMDAKLAWEDTLVMSSSP